MVGRGKELGLENLRPTQTQGSVLVCCGCHNKCHRLGDLPDVYFSESLYSGIWEDQGAGKIGSWDSSFSVFQMANFSLYPLTVERESSGVSSSSWKGTNPIMKALPS